MRYIVAILLGGLLISGCSSSSGEYERTGLLMGTFVQVKVFSPGESREILKRAVDRALEAAAALEKKFSIFDPASEVNKINLAGGGEVSPELLGLLRQAGEVSRITDGGFDVTVAPVLKTAGFYEYVPGQIRDSIPDGHEGVGWKNVRFDPDGKSIKLHQGAWMDLGGIAKGYIVDRMVELLEEAGIPYIMINAGGDIYCGEKANGVPWKIGIREPGTDSVVVVLNVTDMAVATSGDYENVVTDEKTGGTKAHIIDPLCKKAVGKIPSSYTVIAPTCSEADALATGMMVMGRDKALRLSDKMEDVELIVVEGSVPDEEISFSQGAEKYVYRKFNTG